MCRSFRAIPLLLLAILLPVLGCTPLIDADEDGFSIDDGDCDDDDPAIYPGAREVPNGYDDDCDTVIDENVPNFDDDGDGVTELAGDCNDDNADIYPLAEEVLNGLDDDCDSLIDEGTVAFDDDADGLSEQAGDCDDKNPAVLPGAVELPNAVDDDCDGAVDEDTTVSDDDSDGMTEADGDCNDFNSTVYAGAPEQENSIDDDCDGTVDEGTNAFDDDGDAFSENEGDCEDANPGIFPGAPETGLAGDPNGDGLDNDCDGLVDEGTLSFDDDQDGFSENGKVGGLGDCNDDDPTIFPNAPESYVDVIDSDCDGFLEKSIWEDPPQAVPDVKMDPSSFSIDDPWCDSIANISSLQPFSPKRYYYVHFFDVRDDNGENGVPDLSGVISEQLAKANDYFDDLGVGFKKADVTVIHNTDWNELDVTTGSLLELMCDPCPNACPCSNGELRVFFVSDLAALFLGLAGYAFFPDEATGHHAVVLNWSADNVHAGQVFPHELGHLFGLWHTHHGSYGESGQAELVDGGNCETAGDLLCDTPADPGPYEGRGDLEYCTAVATPGGTCAAECVGGYAADVTNVMSYHRPESCFVQAFSLQQQRRMLCAMKNSPSLAEALSCGDGQCDSNEECDVCDADCGNCPACPNGECESTESCDNCPDDCGECPGGSGGGGSGGGGNGGSGGGCAVCPNGTCETQQGESCNSCPSDCGQCPPQCIANGDFCIPIPNVNGCCPGNFCLPLGFGYACQQLAVCNGVNVSCNAGGVSCCADNICMGGVCCRPTGGSCILNSDCCSGSCGGAGFTCN
ncbi:MAG: hypothetical protein IPK82_13455 [Polyangiaceae bacterium]|nr:hypothetical protein [Polyangiaceae bacterium]